MKIEYVDVTPKVEVVPFVLGGVYWSGIHLYLLTRRSGGGYQLATFDDGTATGDWFPFTDDAVRYLNEPGVWTYIPDARLCVPRPTA